MVSEVVVSYLSQTLQDHDHQSLDNQLPRKLPRIILEDSIDIEINKLILRPYIPTWEYILNVRNCNLATKDLIFKILAF